MSSCEPECICCCLPCISIWACGYFTWNGIVAGTQYCANEASMLRKRYSEGKEMAGQDPEKRAEEGDDDARGSQRSLDSRSERIGHEEKHGIRSQPLPTIMIQIPPKVASSTKIVTAYNER